MKTKYVIIIGVLLFLSFTPFSLAVLKSDSAILDVTLELPIRIEVDDEGDFDYLEIEFIMIPIENNRQKVVSSSYSLEPEIINEGFAQFKISEPEDTKLEINFVIETKADFYVITEKIEFPIKNLDPYFSKYTSSSEVYDINAEIKNLAASLSIEKEDLFEVVLSLSDWVNKNIEYDLDTVSGEKLSASWVLNNKRGVCTEYTSLFVALTRSLGIPAREVSGFAFTDSELFPKGWEFHSWAEVYFPGSGWVPFDPTYGQHGFLDAGHVQLGVSSEEELKQNSFLWRGRNVDVIPGKTDLEVKVVSTRGLKEKSFLEAKTSLLEEHVQTGSYNVLSVDLQNNNPFYVAETIRVSNVEGLTFLTHMSQAIVVPPFQFTTVHLVFRVNDLSEGFIYSFPLKIYLGNEVFSSSFSASKNAPMIKEEDVTMFLETKKAPMQEIVCEVPSTIREGDLLELECDSLGEKGTLCFDNTCENFNENEKLVLRIETTEPGLFAKPVTFESNKFSAMTFVRFLIIDYASLDLSNTKHSEVLFPGETALINVSLKKDSVAIPKNVSLIINHKHFQEELVLEEIREEFIFSFYFPANNLRRKENQIIIETIFFDDLGEKYISQKTIIMSVEGLSLLDEINFFFKRIYFWFTKPW